MKCPKCGNENDDAAKFCKKCGAPLQSTSKEIIKQETKNQNQKIIII